MTHPKPKRAVLVVLALLALAGCFQILGAYERGYIGSVLLALLLALVCLLLFYVFIIHAQALDKQLEKKKLPAGRQPKQRAHEKHFIISIDNYTEDVKP